MSGILTCVTRPELKKPKVLLVGGVGHNIPDELKAAVDIVKHIEQGTRKLADLPAAQFILVMSEFVSHNMVEILKNEAAVPIIYLKKSWASMREELMKRCILPPDPGPGGEAPAVAALNPKTGTLCGLTEAEIWDKYQTKFMDAIRDTLRPRELVSESDLLEILALAAGVPASDCALVLHELSTPGVISSPKEGYWVSRLGSDGFDDWEGGELPAEPSSKTAKKQKQKSRHGGDALVVRNAERKENLNERAAMLRGLPLGPYASKQAIIREMLKYVEWSHYKDSYGKFQPLLRLINRAIELKYIDDTTRNFLIDHDEKVGLRQVLPPERLPAPPPVEPTPVLFQTPQAVFPGETGEAFSGGKEAFSGGKEAFSGDKEISVAAAAISEMTRIERRWPELVIMVKKEKRHIGTILESCRFHWLKSDELVGVIVVPQEFKMYWTQLHATENWGLVFKTAREILHEKIAVRYLMANGT